jgi:hypothetical protein
VNWLYDPAHRTEAFAVYARHAPHGGAGAQSAYAVLFDHATGYRRDGAIDRACVATVIALRARYDLPRKSLGTTDDYCDETFLQEALRR